MKRKILSILLVAVMLLSAIAGLAGCGKSGFASTEIASHKAAEIGNLKKDDWILSVPAGAFDGDVSVIVAKASEREEVLLTTPIDISVEGMEQVRLNQPVKITMKLDKKNIPDAESFDRTVMAYWNGSEWEPIIPDPVRLSEGYLEFETWRFSSYSGKLMNREEQIKLYAHKMAVDSVSNEVKDPTYIEKIKAVCNDYFDGVGLYTGETREIIINRALEMNIIPTTQELAAKGDIKALTYECGKILAEATIDMVQENPLVKESLMEGLGKLGTLTQGAEALYNGDYKTAVVEFTDLGVTLGRLPHWDLIKQKILEIGNAYPQLKFLGFDIIITPEGFKIIEINSFPDAPYMQICYPFMKTEIGRRFFTTLLNQKSGVKGVNA